MNGGDRPWRAGRGQIYYFVDSRESVIDGMDERHVRPCMETGHPFDDEHYASGNYYRTRDEASRNATVPERNKCKHVRDPKENFDRDAYLAELHALKELRRLGLAEPISAKYKKNKSYKIEKYQVDGNRKRD